MFEWVLIVIELVILAATTSVYLLARRTAIRSVATQKNLDELLQELQATSEIVINDLNTRTAALRTLLEQADGRRRALEAVRKPAQARSEDGEPGRSARPAPGRPGDPLAARNKTGARAEPGLGERTDAVLQLAQQGMDVAGIAQKLRLTREEVSMTLAGPSGTRSSL